MNITTTATGPLLPGEVRKLAAGWPKSYAGFESLPCIHSILKGAADGCDGVGILSNPSFLPAGDWDVWGDTWIEARACWIKEVAPHLLA